MAYPAPAPHDEPPAFSTWRTLVHLALSAVILDFALDRWLSAAAG